MDAGFVVPTQRKGFTLAEVLIALVVIGIVAAITVPAIVANAQKRELVERLKKNYALFTEVTNKIMAEEGSPKDDWGSSVNNIYDRYKRHLSVIKDCGAAAGCVSQGAYNYLKKNMSANWDTTGSYRKLILADGTQVIFYPVDSTCSEQNYTAGGDNDVCATVTVDVNGEKNPNRIGRDVFRFSLKPDGLHPMGCDNPQCGENSDVMGYGCACKVLREGAMNY